MSGRHGTGCYLLSNAANSKTKRSHVAILSTLQATTEVVNQALQLFFLICLVFARVPPADQDGFAISRAGVDRVVLHLAVDPADSAVVLLRLRFGKTRERDVGLVELRKSLSLRSVYQLSPPPLTAILFLFLHFINVSWKVKHESGDSRGSHDVLKDVHANR